MQCYADFSAERQHGLSLNAMTLARSDNSHASRALRCLLQQSSDSTAGSLREKRSREAGHTCRVACEAGGAPELGSLGMLSSLLGCSMTSRNAVAASPKYTVTSRLCPNRASPSFPFRSCSCDRKTKEHQPLYRELHGGVDVLRAGMA